KHQDSRALVFVRTKEDARKIRQALEAVMPGLVGEIHSNKAQHTRLAAMNQFRRGDVRVLVSTDVSSRGIDVPETEVVVNFTVPRMSDDYVHRIGRTGRANRSGIAYTFVDPTDMVALERVLERLPKDGRPSWKEFPAQVEVSETPPWEAKAMARTIDFQKRKADPTYKGAFHEKKKKSSGKVKKRRR
ncbi:MAG: helicase-related protein, partial [Flavobacteriales bacterium]